VGCRDTDRIAVAGCRPTDLLDLNVKTSAWRDTFADNRAHEVTGKVPSLAFGNEERQLLRLVGGIPFNADDVESAGVTKSFRVRFDRCTHSVPPNLVGQNVVVRANDEAVAIFLGPKQIAMHRRSWEIGQDIEHPAHRESALAKKPRATAGDLPPGLFGLGDIGVNYFKVLADGSRSGHREIVSLTLLVLLCLAHCGCLYLAGGELGRKTQFGMRARFATQKLYGVVELLTVATRPEANRRKVQQVGEALEVLPITLSTAARFGVLKHQLASRGRTKADVDLHIAASAIDAGARWSPTTAPSSGLRRTGQ
jgi:hypothetical protein